MQSHAANVTPIDAPSLRASDQPWSRLAWGSALILAVTGVFTAWCDTPMIWDGAYQFASSLIQQKPYFYLTRFHSYILWTPMVWLSHVTTNLTILKMAYGLPFTLAPAFSVLASWWVVRKRAPHLVLWAIFGAAAAPLPGQIFIINDSIFQQHMFWPVFLGLLVPLEWPQIVALALLVVFQFAHQIGFVLLAGGAGAAACLALRDRENRRQLLIKASIASVLAFIALWKIFHFPDSYAQREFTWEAAHNAWTWGVAGWPLRGLELMWAAGGVALVARLLSGTRYEPFRKEAWLVAALCVVAAMVLWVIWASSAHRWTTAANYRRWVVPLTIPFYLLAFLDQFLKVPAGVGPTPTRSPVLLVGYLVAATFAVILSIQSVIWLRLTRHLLRDVEPYPRAIVPWNAISWTADTALYHWGTASYVYVLEGRVPRHLMLDPLAPDSEKQLAMLRANPPMIPLASFTPVDPNPGPAGWFDFRPMLKNIEEQMRMQNAK
jgi:hypothetical protein